MLDCCAAPGGKSVLLASECGRVISNELYPHRVKLITQYKERMAAENVYESQADSTVFNPEYEEKFDGVLCDVPCSGFGTVSENPDIKLNADGSNLDSLNKTQLSILENCSKYVKRGGNLYYSTCSLFPCENDGIIRKFLLSHPEFIVEEKDSPLSHEKTEFGLQFLPDTAFGAGFYICAMKRK